MDEKINRFTCLKVGKKPNLEKLSKGSLYCRSLNYYAASENHEEAFYDKYEGISALLMPGSNQIEITGADGKTHIIKDFIDCQIRSHIAMRPAFCLFTLRRGSLGKKIITTEEEYQTEIDEICSYTKLETYGDHLWIILDYAEFRKRIVAAVTQQNIGVKEGLVQYHNFDTKDHIQISEQNEGFIKHSKFQHEKETRFLFNGINFPDPFILEIGDLRDISIIIPLKDHTKHINFNILKNADYP